MQWDRGKRAYTGVRGALAAVLVGALALGSSQALPAESVPDITGVWTQHVVPGQARAGGGFGGASASLPYTPEGRRRNEEYRKLLGPENANAAAYCVDYGMPMMMEQVGAYPIEFIQRPDQVTVIYEVEGELRRIYLGGRSIPANKRLPTCQGYSTGRWEKNVLVVETSDLEDGEDQVHP